MHPGEIRQAISRMAEAMLVDADPPTLLAFIGIHRGGVPIAEALSQEVTRRCGLRQIVGVLDAREFRDDAPGRVVHNYTRISEPVDDLTVVLVDDVIHTGRTSRAALAALNALGTPRYVRLAALIDRGGREVPLGAEYVGKHLPAEPDAVISVSQSGVYVGRQPR